MTSPLVGVYPFSGAGPGGSIVLHDGPVVVHLGDEDIATTGRIRLDVVGGLDIYWSADASVPLGELELTLHRDTGDVRLRAAATHSAGSGYVQHADLGAGEKLEYVLVHWFNLPSMLPASRLVISGGWHAGRWICEAQGWRLTLDARPDHGEAIEKSRASHAATMTHVGRLERVDGSFTAVDAVKVLDGWQTALSFATGRWVAPALPVGFDAHEERVWEQWANWRCSTYHGYMGWWDNHRSDDLDQMCRQFIAHWLDPTVHAALRHTTYHAVCANSDQATLEARVMLAQAGLEYLGWVTNVLEGGVPAREYKNRRAEEKLEGMLSAARIPLDMPPEFSALSTLAPADRQNGPQALTWLRNRLVHPKNADEPYRVRSALTNAWQLSVEYLDLLILSRLGYQGFCLPNRPGVWAHDSIAVPWTEPSAIATADQQLDPFD